MSEISTRTKSSKTTLLGGARQGVKKPFFPKNAFFGQKYKKYIFKIKRWWDEISIFTRFYLNIICNLTQWLYAIGPYDVWAIDFGRPLHKTLESIFWWPLPSSGCPRLPRPSPTQRWYPCEVSCVVWPVVSRPSAACRWVSWSYWSLYVSTVLVLLKMKSYFI